MNDIIDVSREISTESEGYAKSNFLIGSKYKSSLFCNKLMALSLYYIANAEEDSKTGIIKQTMYASAIRDRLGVKGGGIYKQLEKAAKSMTGQTIGMSDPENERFEYISVIIRASYEKGVFTIEYNPHIKKYIKDIKSNFSYLNISLMLSFKSNASFRLYELLRSKAFYKKGAVKLPDDVFKVSFLLSELKLNLGVINANLDKVRNVLDDSANPDYDKAAMVSPEKTLENWIDFRNRCLDVAVNEINEISDMLVSYDTERCGYGGRVHAVNFYVKYRHVNKEEEESDKVESLSEEMKLEFLEKVSDLINIPLKIKDLRAICEAADYDFNKINTAYQIVNSSKTPIDNFVGYMISAIKKEYAEPITVEAPIDPTKKPTRRRVNKFNNFSQRDYDYEQLEMMLLNTSPKGD